MHAYCYCAIYNECLALTSFGDIYVPACHCFCGHTLTIPPPHTLPYCPQTQHPTSALSQTLTIGGGLPPLIMGAQRLNLLLAHGSATLFVFMLAATSTMRNQDLKPGLAPS